MGGKKTLMLGSAIVLILALGGCGGGNGDVSTSPGQVVTDFWAGVSQGDARTSYDLLSTSDQKELSYGDFEKMVAEDQPEESSSMDALFKEINPPEESTDVEIISENIDGNTATVRASFQGGQIDFKLVREDGAWKFEGMAQILNQANASAARGACLDNMRTITSAAMQYKYSTANGSYPQTIEELIPYYMREMPVCRAAGTYSINSGENWVEVTCSVHGSLPGFSE
jgi:hypothetical protein